MEEKRVVEVKEVFEDSSIYGYLGGVVTYTPKVFEDMGVPKKKQFSVGIEPMSDEDCTAINSLNKEERLRMSLWYVSEEGKKFQEANEKLMKFTEDGDEFTDEDFDTIKLIEKHKDLIDTSEHKLKIVQKYIKNLSSPHPLAKKGIISDKAWRAMPLKIKADIYNAIIDISMLSEQDAINLQ